MVTVRHLMQGGYCCIMHLIGVSDEDRRMVFE